MSTYMQYRAPPNTFKPTQWTRTLIRNLRKYTYSQWIDRNGAIHGATLTALRAKHRLSLKTQIQEACHNSSTIPVDKWSITFGIPITLHLVQTTSNMGAWLLQYQAGQKRLANILIKERRKQYIIIRFHIFCTRGRCPDKPPGLTNRYPHHPMVSLPSPRLKCYQTNRLALHYDSIL